MISESLAELPSAEGPEGEASLGLDASALGMDTSREISNRRDAAAAGKEMIKQVNFRRPWSLGGLNLVDYFPTGSHAFQLNL